MKYYSSLIDYVSCAPFLLHSHLRINHDFAKNIDLQLRIGSSFTNVTTLASKDLVENDEKTEVKMSNVSKMMSKHLHKSRLTPLLFSCTSQLCRNAGLRCKNNTLMSHAFCVINKYKTKLRNI